MLNNISISQYCSNYVMFGVNYSRKAPTESSESRAGGNLHGPRKRQEKRASSKVHP